MPNASVFAEASAPDKPRLTLYPPGMIDIATGNIIAETAFLMGDPARANMLAALMSGEALTAGELAAHAGVTPQTASGHLGRLTGASLVAVERQGRHRYFRLASAEVAQALEVLMGLSIASSPPRRRPHGPRDAAMRLARSCYDHLAGRLGVAIADALQRRGLLHIADGIGILSDEGHSALAYLGIDVARLAGGSRPFCRTCLDWSERRPHLAGKLGAAILDRTVELGWLARVPKSRTLRISPAGERGFAETFRCEAVWSATLGKQRLDDAPQCEALAFRSSSRRS